MFVIETDCLLASMLLELPRVTSATLAVVRNAMAEAHPDIYIDTTAAGRTGALSERPDLFRCTGFAIEAATPMSREFVDAKFSWYVPQDVMESLRSAISSAKEF